MPNEHFFPPIEPFASGRLAVDDVHEIYWEQCGNPDGQPVLFIHGGPGAGCSQNDRCFFDPEVFRVVLVDQRGCGRSSPLGELTNNTPSHLAADFEAIRREFGIDTWHVFGGSWGSTLSLFYAQEYPDAVRSLVLRGIWLIRESEIRWWLYEMGQIQPELWKDFAAHIPEAEHDDLLEAYWNRLTGDDREAALEAAKHWSIYEGSCCTLLPNPEFADAFGDHTAIVWFEPGRGGDIRGPDATGGPTSIRWRLRGPRNNEIAQGQAELHHVDDVACLPPCALGVGDVPQRVAGDPEAPGREPGGFGRRRVGAGSRQCQEETEHGDRTGGEGQDS